MANQLTMADINHIKSLAAAGWSRRRIARETGCDRATIRKYLESEADPDPREGPVDPGPGSDSKPANVIAGNNTASPGCCDRFRDMIESLLEKGLTAEGSESGGTKVGTDKVL